MSLFPCSQKNIKRSLVLSLFHFDFWCFSSELFLEKCFISCTIQNLPSERHSGLLSVFQHLQCLSQVHCFSKVIFFVVGNICAGKSNQVCNWFAYCAVSYWLHSEVRVCAHGRGTAVPYSSFILGGGGSVNCNCLFPKCFKWELEYIVCLWSFLQRLSDSTHYSNLTSRSLSSVGYKLKVFLASFNFLPACIFPNWPKGIEQMNTWAPQLQPSNPLSTFQHDWVERSRGQQARKEGALVLPTFHPQLNRGVFPALLSLPWQSALALKNFLCSAAVPGSGLPADRHKGTYWIGSKPVCLTSVKYVPSSLASFLPAPVLFTIFHQPTGKRSLSRGFHM